MNHALKHPQNSTRQPRVWRVLGLMLGLAAATPAWAQNPTSPAIQTADTRAVVAGAPYAELLLSDALARGASDSPALRARVRETVIDLELMAQAALKAELQNQAPVRARLAWVRQNALAQAWQQQLLSGVRITEAELANEYQRQLQALGGEEVQLRHVLLSDAQQAQQVLAQVQGGAALASLATTVSQDKGTRGRGGLSDWVPLGSLAPGVAQAVKTLMPGDMATQPIQTPSGWQVIQLEARRPLTPPPMATVQAQLRQTLEQRALKAGLQALRDGARIP
jgi:peptidyl-prolyl cis-trans isomerase C